MGKVYLLEDQRGGEPYKAYQNFGDVLKFVVKEIENDSTQDYKNKFDRLKQLVDSMAARYKQDWGEGFFIDDMYYCWAIEFITDLTFFNKGE